MARARKPKSPQTVPLAPPSSRTPQVPGKPLIEIPEDEQWRLIKQTGILSSASLEGASAVNSNNNETLSLSDEIFNAILLIIPFSSILLLMEVLIRQQYGKETTLDVVMDRMVPGVPILSVFIFYTLRYKQDRRMQALLFFISVLVGSRMLYSMTNASWLVNMQQCPPLATIWIYTVVQLELGPAVASLAVIGAFVWWKDITIFQ
ncbi:hypothetical protein D9613_005184 [Agrocybe pediades]|uniref:DUF7719 domain-containing protein n=1 Tax=Agrocybe pediades TaxID=84607 RepID=A0A8H4R0C8_9AGAR|nr:hypothetical protein D9613_005184 [Agrocybe pediades]